MPPPDDDFFFFCKILKYTFFQNTNAKRKKYKYKRDATGRWNFSSPKSWNINFSKIHKYKNNEKQKRCHLHKKFLILQNHHNYFWLNHKTKLWNFIFLQKNTFYFAGGRREKKNIMGSKITSSQATLVQNFAQIIQGVDSGASSLIIVISSSKIWEMHCLLVKRNLCTLPP